MKKYDFECYGNLNEENKEIRCKGGANSILIIGYCEFHLDVENKNKIIYVKKRDYICAPL
jgi:hypothetical protein